MTFAELTRQIGELGLIPRQELPYFGIVLEEETKMKLTERSPQEVAMYMMWAVKQINRGSVERVDTLIRRAMEELR